MADTKLHTFWKLHNLSIAETKLYTFWNYTIYFETTQFIDSWNQTAHIFRTTGFGQAVPRLCSGEVKSLGGVFSFRERLPSKMGSLISPEISEHKNCIFSNIFSFMKKIYTLLVLSLSHSPWKLNCSISGTTHLLIADFCALNYTLSDSWFLCNELHTFWWLIFVHWTTHFLMADFLCTELHTFW